jgi:hypothetical protein
VVDATGLMPRSGDNAGVQEPRSWNGGSTIKIAGEAADGSEAAAHLRTTWSCRPAGVVRLLLPQ